MAGPVNPTKVQADLRKEKGNEYFSKGKLGAAIDAYTEAIALCPTVPAYWTNRAVCFKKRNDWEKVQSDCKKALELDKRSFKAQRLLGTALLQLKLYPEAVRALTRAVEIGSASGLPLSDSIMCEVIQELNQAKYEQWQIEATERRAKQKELRDYLRQLIHADHARRVAERGEEAVDRMEVEREVSDRDSSSHGAEPRLDELLTDRINTLENVFDAAQAPDIVGEAPEHLTCKITMDLFQDPVITPSGITYERAAILDHISRGRNFDPSTRAPLEVADLVPNLAVRDAVHEFLLRHGWAYHSLSHPSS